MATENVLISIDEKGAVTVARNIENIGKSAESAATGVGVLKTALAALMAVMSFNVFKEFSSTWVQLKSQVDGFTSSMRETNSVMDRLVEIANRNQAALDITAQTYIGNAAALKELGYSTKSQIDFTEAMTNALTVSGAKGQQAETVINALSKAMMKGKLDGMNWQTVLQSGGRVVTAMADGMGVSLAKLREMAGKGQLSSETVFTALTSQLEKLREEADNMPSTINDAFQKMKTSMTAAIGKFDEDFGITEKFVSFFGWISEHLNVLIPIILGVGAAVASAFAPTIILSFTAALKTLTFLLLANPLTALATAIIGMTVALASFYASQEAVVVKNTEMASAAANAATEIEKLSGKTDDASQKMRDYYQSIVDAENVTVTYGDIASVVWEDIANGAVSMWQTIVGVFSHAIDNMSDGTSSFGSFVGDVFYGIWMAIKAVVNGIVAIFFAGFVLIENLWNDFPNVARAALKSIGNMVVKAVEFMVNSWQSGFRSIAQLAGTVNEGLAAKINGALDKTSIKLPKFELSGGEKAAAKNVRDGLKTAFTTDFLGDGVKAGADWVTGYAKGVKDRAAKRKIDEVNKGLVKPSPFADTAKPTDSGKGKGGKDNTAKELEQLIKAYESLKGSLDPIWKAQEELTKSEETLNKAMSAGLVSLEEKDRLMGLLSKKYQDALDPLGKINRDMQKEQDLLKLDANSRKIKIELDKHIQDLQAKGKVLKDEEIEGLRKSIVLQQEEIRLAQIRDNLMANSNASKQSSFQEKAGEAFKLLDDPSSKFTEGDLAQSLGLDSWMTANTKFQYDIIQNQTQEHLGKLEALEQASGDRRMQYQASFDQMRANIQQKQREDELNQMSGFWGSLSNLSRSENSKLAAVGKAAAVAQATMNTFVAGSKALAEGGPYAGPAMQAAIIAQGMINVAQIAATNLGFKTGGSFIVGGSGAPDSQQVAFRASPGEKVSITKANNVKKGDQGGEEGSSQSNGGGTKIINVVGDGPIENYMTSSSGERVFLNYIGENKSAIKAMLE